MTDLFDNDSFVVIFTYVFKALMAMYFSSFQSVIKRVGFIVLDSPAYTFFPLVLLSMVTYVMAFSIYLLREQMMLNTLVRSYGLFGSLLSR